MVNVKSPPRWVRKQFRSMDIHPDGKHPRGEYFMGPDHKRILVLDGINAGAAVILVSHTRAQLGLDQSIEPRRTATPQIDRARLRLTVHARERWTEMQSQAAISAVELEACLFTPAETSYSVKHDSWIFSVGRLCAAVVFDDDGFATVKTIMWSRPDLFEQHPRQETTARQNSL
ncbi:MULTISPECIES: hypothetical protein [unclassified Cryobacterium]|uniref:hypothetical protein n=1 Tax=unclassified Cryobacterium TaxID=2649013 RepID=UPI00106CB816|nr:MULTISPECIES: hypothetical protein [unclassified Cryobacterium]TFC59462.1 hypothetical protein E3O68_00755 [Cryobacterium sp. TMB3-1-2]TFC67258.1 hypothetical protein E3T21_17450 [Cryobacterium sp. TMB3-15]TFC73229.1 hypothetical protein E3T22_16605 [Cryobacterium sp. TMB3-10]TFD46117.1 hypothetical protein E3T58_01240 [Cryobacterium sp. TMB3-12]